MFRIFGALLRATYRIPGIGSLVDWAVARVKREAREMPRDTRAKYLAVQFDMAGIPAIAGAAVSESLAAGIVVAAGISPANDRPYSMFIVAPDLPHDRRREVYEEMRSQIDKAIGITIDVPR